jgi:AraC-like DNA-binding protein
VLPSDHLTLRLVRLKNGDSWSQKRHGLSFVFSKGGAGKCVSGAANLPFVPGDVLILNGPDAAKLVCSNGELVFWSFSLSIEHLFPLFAGSEISLLQTVAERLRSLKVYPARTPIASTCHKLIKEVPTHVNLDHRCHLLRVATAVLTDEFDAARERSAGLMRMEDHIVQVFEALTADEILHLPIADLAQRFGCSRRHLNRLFHQYFWLSVASLKMEMRLLKAVSLLRDPNAKIINVAESCGFHHLGLFNTCFRKRFGTSPGEWRKRTKAADENGAGLTASLECPLRNNGLCSWASNAALRSPSNPTELTSPEKKEKSRRPDAARAKSKKSTLKKLKVVSTSVCPADGHLTFQVKDENKPEQNGSAKATQ